MKQPQIKINVLEWKSKEFVQFFYRCYDEVYNAETVVTTADYNIDCHIMKQLITSFRKLDRSKRVVFDFLKWAFEAYTNNKEYQKNTGKLTLPFLRHMISDYLKMPVERILGEIKAKKRKGLSIEMQKFLREQKRLYKKGLKEYNESKHKR